MYAASSESLEANKNIVRRFLAEMDNGNFAIFKELLSPDLVVHFPGARLDREQTEATARIFYVAFPDFSHTVEELLAFDDKVVLRATDRGTHRGDFPGIPATDRSVAFGVITIYRIADGRITEVWEQADLLGMMRQLGVELPGS